MFNQTKKKDKFKDHPDAYYIKIPEFYKYLQDLLSMSSKDKMKITEKKSLKIDLLGLYFAVYSYKLDIGFEVTKKQDFKIGRAHV